MNQQQDRLDWFTKTLFIMMALLFLVTLWLYVG